MPGDLQRDPLPEISSQGGRDPEQLQRVSFQKPNGTERNREKPKGTGTRCRNWLQRDPSADDLHQDPGAAAAAARAAGTGAGCRRSAAGAISCSHRRGIRASGRQNGQTDGQTATGGRNRANLAESGQRQRDPLARTGTPVTASHRVTPLLPLSTNQQPTIH